MVDFSTPVLKKLCIGDRIQIDAFGLGMGLSDHPGIRVFSCSPGLIRKWGVISAPPRLKVPVTHLIPASIMGSGIGKSSAVRGDFDIQLFDPETRRRFGLETLRFGDIVAILDSDTRLGRAYRKGIITIGVVVHGDSTVSGHGPGVMSLLSAPENEIRPVRSPGSNLAAIFGARKLKPAKRHRPLVKT
jgi:hypothetical protein